MSLLGSIDLLKLEKAGIVAIKGVKCVVIPIPYNDIYCKVDETTLKPSSAKLGVSVFERKEVGKYGDTHNVKQTFGKEFLEQQTQEARDAMKSKYIGNLKYYADNTIENAETQDVTQNIPKEAVDELPF